jgi:hypothetical protein
MDGGQADDSDAHVTPPLLLEPSVRLDADHDPLGVVAPATGFRRAGPAAVVPPRTAILAPAATRTGPMARSS